jgi:hypothetical protein
MSWNDIKDKNIPLSKRNLASVSQAVNEVAAMAVHAAHVAVVGKNAIVAAVMAMINAQFAAQYKYKTMLTDVADSIVVNAALKEQVRAMIRAFCVALDS